MVDATHTTRLLVRARQGDAQASAELFPIVYEELRRLAGQYMAHQGAAHTLQPTALVHEAYVRLVDVDLVRVTDRTHFFRLAASAMRSALVDHARARRRLKRGGERLRLTLDEAVPSAVAEAAGTDLVDLDASLARLQAMDEQLAQQVELRFFAGLTHAEIAELQGVSTRTVERGWRVARAWLAQDLGACDPD